MIDDLFELSQIDAGSLELHAEPANLADLVSDSLEALTAQARQRQVILRGKVDPALAAVMVDCQRMQRVLYNLLQNAVRHTPADGTVVIRAIDAGPELHIMVGIRVRVSSPKTFPGSSTASTAAATRLARAGTVVVGWA